MAGIYSIENGKVAMMILSFVQLGHCGCEIMKGMQLTL